MNVGDLVTPDGFKTDCIRIYNVESPDGGGDDDFELPYRKIFGGEILLVVSDQINKMLNHDDDVGTIKVISSQVKILKSDGTLGWVEVDWLKKL